MRPAPRAPKGTAGLAFGEPNAIVGSTVVGSPVVPRRFCRSLVLLLALGLTACGVKGPLEPPPQAKSQAGSQAGAQPGAPRAGASSVTPSTPSSQASAGTAAIGSETDEAQQEGETAWGANPRASTQDVPPDMPGDSVSRPVPHATGSKGPVPQRQKFFLDFLL